MKKIDKKLIKHLFEQAFKDEDLIKLLNIQKDPSKNKENYTINISITSDEDRIINLMKINKNLEYRIISDLKDFILKKALDHAYLNKKLINKNEISEIASDELVIGGSGALVDLPDHLTKVLDYNKKFEDTSVLITKKLNLFIDYTSISLQVISMDKFAPQLNLKFSFCIEGSN
jgi:hypothetical protein